MYLAAFGLCTGYGPGLAPVIKARADSDAALHRRSDFIGSDYLPQLCAFSPKTGISGLVARGMALVAAALDDLSAEMSTHEILWPSPLRLVLLTPDQGIGLPKATADVLADQIEQGLRASGWFAGDAIRVQGGGGALAKALCLASDLRAPVLLVAVDSHACRTRLSALLDAGALFSRATPWGFVPGEAASAVLLVPDEAKQALGIKKGAGLRVSAACQAIEPIPAHLNQDSTFSGMTEAALFALETHATHGLAPPSRFLTDWNNGRYRAAEFSYTMLRLSGLLATDCHEAEHPAQAFGQCGAGWLAPVLADIAASRAEIIAQVGAGCPTTLVLSGDEESGMRSGVIFTVS